MPISPWESFAESDSPDGRFIARYGDGIEIAMGAPTRGVIKISEKKTGHCLIELEGTNASFVWSSDSSALAFPRWTRGRAQQLVVFHLAAKHSEPLAGEYRVLELSSFCNGVIEGIDSPIYLPAKIRIAVTK